MSEFVQVKYSSVDSVSRKCALITGITGQDGSYLAEYLLSLGYEVHGLVRGTAIENSEHRFSRIGHLLDRIELHSGSDGLVSLYRVLSHKVFDEVYHLAAQSVVAEPLTDGLATISANIEGIQNVLAAFKELQPMTRVYFAGSSEMFGAAEESPQNEQTRFRPRSPYGISKVAGFHLVSNYRETYGMHCCTGILFNHESPRRRAEFISRKISSGVAKIVLGTLSEIRLGDLDARRDWGHAADYVKAMHAMLQTDEARDYVIATGTTHSVRDLCQIAFSAVGLEYSKYVKQDERFIRPPEKFLLVGDPSMARRILGWTHTVSFGDLISEMVRHDLDAYRQCGVTT